MRKIGFYGNCQLRQIKGIMRRLDCVQEQFEIVDIKQIQEIQDSDIGKVIEVVKKVDLFIYQRVKGSHAKGTDNVLQFLKKDCQRICIPSLTFEGYNPELKKVKIGKQPIKNPFTGELHDIFVLAYYLRYQGKDCIDEVIDFCNRPDLYDEKFLANFFSWTINQLQYREEENAVDIKISDYIVEHYKNQKLFADSNHPYPPLYSHILNQIFDIINSRFDCYPSLTTEKLSSINHGHGHQFAIYPSVLKKLNLDFSENNDYVFNGEIISKKDFIERLFITYNEIEQHKLLEALLYNQRYRQLKACLPFSLEDDIEVYLSSANQHHKTDIESFTYLKEVSSIYRNQGKWNSLVKCYKQMIAIQPEETDAYFELARLYKEQGKRYRAIAVYQDLIDIAPDSVIDIYEELSELLSQKQDEIREALEIYQKVGSTREDWSADFYVKLADLSMEKSEYDAALSYASKAVELDSQAPYNHVLLGNTLFATENYDEAIKSYNKAIQIKPENFYAHRRIGDALVEKNELTTAVSCYLKVLQLNPKATHLNSLIGDVLSKQGKLTEAEEYYQKINS